MANTNLVSAVAGPGRSLYLYLSRGGKRWIARLDGKRVDFVRRVPNAGKLFEWLEHPELGPCAVLVHDFDLTLKMFALSGGRGRTVKSELPRGAGFVQVLKRLSNRLYLRHYRGSVEVFDGERRQPMSTGLSTGRDNLGGDDIVEAWDGALVLCRVDGLYREQGGRWRKLAAGRQVRAMVFDPERAELCVVGPAVSYVRADGSEESVEAETGDLWAAALHAGDLYGYDFTDGVVRVQRDGTVTTLGKSRVPISRNHCLIATGEELYFAAKDGVHRLRGEKWTRVVDVSKLLPDA